MRRLLACRWAWAARSSSLKLPHVRRMPPSCVATGRPGREECLRVRFPFRFRDCCKVQGSQDAVERQPLPADCPICFEQIESEEDPGMGFFYCGFAIDSCIFKDAQGR